MLFVGFYFMFLSCVLNLSTFVFVSILGRYTTVLVMCGAISLFDTAYFELLFVVIMLIGTPILK